MILSIEGLKGSGKTTLINRLKDRFHINIAKKYTKTQHPGNYSLSEFVSNLFFSLEESIDSDIILDKGLITLSTAGLYGYAKENPGYSFDNYKEKNDKLLDNLIMEYRRFEDNTIFVILNCNTEERVKRVLNRPAKKPSDIYFLENIKDYLTLFERNVEVVKKSLKKSRFAEFNNNNFEDLDPIFTYLKQAIICNKNYNYKDKVYKL